MKKRFYVAYGSNLNFKQMKYRCPTAIFIGAGMIRDYELQFRGRPDNAYATIAPKVGTSVPVGVWQIQPRDELALDRYEGFPVHYQKKQIPVILGDDEVSAMGYIMNPNFDFGIPSPHYFSVVHQGYMNCGLDTSVLEQAVEHSARQYYKQVLRDAQRSDEAQDSDEAFVNTDGMGMDL